jgi:hypothetical protein
MKRSPRNTKNQAGNLPFHFGHQWGEHPDGESSLLMKQAGAELEITAAMPGYLTGNHPCDLVRHYEIACKNRAIGKQRTGKDSPHIRFANSDSDEQLIAFVHSFGPVVAKNWDWVAAPPRPWDVGDPPPQILMRARQDLQELRSEQRIYKAAFGLVTQLAKQEVEFDFDLANRRIKEIAKGIQNWSKQWNREKKKRGENPLWRVRRDSIQRIAALAESGPDLLLPPQVDVRIVLSELVNVFPLLAFPNPLEMHSYIRFGIRPLLYSILRREFLQPREVGICANTHCRSFFEVERAGQRFCDQVCSRQHRQREYWRDHGKTARRKRLGAQSKRRNAKLLRPTSPGRAN